METPDFSVNPKGEVLALTPENFSETLGAGDVFVKFFAPWYFDRSSVCLRIDAEHPWCRCGHCKHLAPTWAELGKKMQYKLTIAEVNCEDHKSLCREQGVTGFPMLIFYPNDGNKSEYTGNRKLPALKAWAEKAANP